MYKVGDNLINEITLSEIENKIKYYHTSNSVVIKNIFLSFTRLNDNYKTNNKSKLIEKIEELENINYALENNINKYQFVISKTINTYKTGALLAAKSFSNIEV